MNKMNSQKVFKIAILCYAAIFVIGILVALIGGIKMDINFSGGSIISCAYNGSEKISANDVKTVVKTITDKKFNVTENRTYDESGNSGLMAYTVTFVGHNSLSLAEQQDIYQGLNFAFAKKDHTYQPHTYAYSYTGEVDAAKVQETLNGLNLDEKVENEFTVADVETADGGHALSVSYAGERWLTKDESDKVNAVFGGTDYAANEIKSCDAMELYSSNSVNPSVAGAFLTKSLAAVVLTALLVIVYVGLRFRRIGGVSAALTALCAVVLDVLVSFFTCVIFRLELDSNYLAVILTILGYSLNDTIVVYDRVRENKKLYPQLPVGENMDMSLKSIMTRNIVTTVTTVLAVITIIVVSEIFGLTTLRTFAIPMTAGLISGCVSSLFIAGPLWVKWCNFRDSRPAKAKK